MKKQYFYDMNAYVHPGTYRRNPTVQKTTPGTSGKSNLMKNKESLLQQRCIRLFATIYPHLWDDKRIHAIPNGGHRSPQTAITLKREGTRAGVWDIQLTIPRGPYAGLWILK